MANEFKVKNGLLVSGSTNINSSGSGIFTVDGTSGRLFAIEDTLSGSLFSVNTAAGLPIIEAFSDNTVRIGQYGQRALFISQSRVGIGLENPTANLHISGTTGGVFEVDVSASLTAFYVSASGNVGIGTSSPAARLTIQGTNGVPAIVQFANDNANVLTQIRADEGNNFAGYYWGTGGTSGYSFDYFGNPRIGDAGGSSTWVFVSSSGNVGIGTTSPSYKLDVNGTARISGDTLITSANGLTVSTTVSSTPAILNAGGSSTAALELQSLSARRFRILSTATATTFEATNTSGFIMNSNLNVQGNVTGSSFTGSFTGSLLGTASFATSASQATTASYILQAVSASFASTASSADNFTVRNTLTATTIVVQTITSSVDFVTGSTRFGSLTSNTHLFTGSVGMTGSLTVVGPVNASSFTGSILGTATTASFVLTAQTASYVLQAVSASFATSASQAISSSFAITASFALDIDGGSY